MATSLEHTTKNQKNKIKDVAVRDVVLSRQKAADRNKSLARTTSVASMVSANIRKDRRRTSKGLTLCCEWLYSPSILESLYAYVPSPIDIDFYLPPPPSRVLSVNSCVRAAVRLCNKCNRYRFFLVGVSPLPSRMFWNLWLGTINTGWGGRPRLICHSTLGRTTSFPLNLQRRPFIRTNREHTRRAFFVGVWRYETINKKLILSQRMVFLRAHFYA